ncbi:MAG: 3-dehydroquinate synthase family protein, partial [Haloechinothrix sp.]
GPALLTALEGIAPRHVIAPAPGEKMKRLATVASLADHAVRLGATRRSIVLAFGGGVVGNVAGLLAGLLFRGIRLIHIPTTIIAATDSVVSLKQAVNSAMGKNHIGVYHQPTAVLTDLAMLATLPARQVRSGWCEFVKNCLAIRPGSIGRLRRVVRGDLLAPISLDWLLRESIAAKAAVMFDDQKERHRGLVLEYGHTIGHAVELADLRRRGNAGLSHGEAVGVGMLAAARLSARRGWLHSGDVSLHRELLTSLGAPVTLPQGLEPSEVTAVVGRDNKRGLLPGADAVFVLLRRLGVPAGDLRSPLTPVTTDEVNTVVKELLP